jgi:D-alanyl-lipoteichoic acid acyltransferase DltB (MBOAT superfamily)
MIFNSLAFLLFFPLVVAGFFGLPYRARWAWLLAASCLFYMAFVPKYILILGFTILVDFAAGLLIARSPRPRKWLIASIVANLGVLFFFKYFNFATTNLAGLAGFLHWNYPLRLLAFALPIGLSFHVFQSLSYTIEVYRGRQAPERHLGIFALYVMFFPQLVAGPIERPQNVLPQFHARQDFDAQRALDGLARMLWGFFKKCVVADRLAPLIAPAFAAPADTPGPLLLLAVVGFAVQIYCDFSGYSDIALGSAQVMGFRLMENFKQPYGARSVQEFWGRWHISLSSWFRDYVYIPLGGNRAHPARNVMAVFLLSGLWHGANWTFVAWGALHGVAVVLERALAGPRARLPGLARWGLTFAFVAVAWIFFRATSLADAWTILGHLGSGLRHQLSSPDELRRTLDALGWANVALGTLAIAALLAVEHGAFPGGIFMRSRALRWGACYAMILALIVLGVYENQAFIYFQF